MRQRSKYVALCSSRLINHAFRSTIDKLILAEFKEIASALQRFRSLSMRLRALPENGKAFLTPEYNERKVALKTKLEKSFSSMIADELADVADDNTHTGRHIDVVSIHVSVTHYMCMVGHKCYFHCPTGIKNCSVNKEKPKLRTEPALMFQTMSYYPASGEGLKTISTFFGRSCCYKAEQFYLSAIRRAGASGSNRLAIEMLRMRNYMPTSQCTMSDLSTALAKSKHMFITTHPDCTVPSLQSFLCMSKAETQSCVREIELQDEADTLRGEAIRRMEKEAQSNEIDRWFKARDDMPINSVDELSVRFPAMGGYLKYMMRTTTYIRALDNNGMHWCLLDIRTMLSVVMRKDLESHGNPASDEAYDFLSGKVPGYYGGTVTKWSVDRWSPMRSVLAEDTLPASTILFRALDVVSAMHAFDCMLGSTLTAKGASVAGITARCYDIYLKDTSTPFTSTEVCMQDSECYKTMKPLVDSFIGVDRRLQREPPSQTIIARARLHNLCKSANAVDEWMCEAYNHWASDKTTLHAALELVAMGPRDLTSLVRGASAGATMM